MSDSLLRLVRVSFRRPSQVQPVFHPLSATFSSGWTGIVGPNGCGKTTLLSLISGELHPGSGSIQGPSFRLICAQRTDEAPEDFVEFSHFPDSESGRWASILGTSPDWPWRWAELSHGERKRAQLATALWRDPEVLMVDEPTNHLDRESRLILQDALRRYRGIGLIVSHDRELMDDLCSRTLFLDRNGSVMRPGGLSAGLEEIEKETLAARRERALATKELKRIDAEAKRRSREAASADRLRSKRDLDKKDSDGRAKKDLARITGRDGRAGELRRQMDDRLRRAKRRLDESTMEVRTSTGVTLVGEASRSDRIVELTAGNIKLGEGGYLRCPDLLLRPDDRLALKGPNGSGKSTLVRALLDRTELTPDRILYMPQEISVAESRRILERIRAMNSDELGAVYSAVDRLGADLRSIMQTTLPSPGEMRKLLLAEGLARRPSWVVMDEPTNHLDVFSVRHVEAALAEYGGALFLVSHDRRFLDSLTVQDWVIERDEEPGDWRLTAE